MTTSLTNMDLENYVCLFCIPRNVAYQWFLFPWPGTFKNNISRVILMGGIAVVKKIGRKNKIHERNCFSSQHSSVKPATAGM